MATRANYRGADRSRKPRRGARRLRPSQVCSTPADGRGEAEAADLREARDEREVAAAFLGLVNESQDQKELIHKAVTFIREKSGCEAVGIRVKDGDDFPYYETQGFPEEFVLLENELCLHNEAGCPVRDGDGYPIMECMCGNVICGRFDPSKPFFTANGSFWTNGTTELLATTSDADRQARTRNRCNGEGYESVALIPLALGEERLGLIQLNDKRKERFSPGMIVLWERLAGYLAVGLARAMAEEALRRANDRVESHMSNSPLAIIEFDPSYRVLRWSGDAERIFGWKRDEIVGKAITEIPWVHEEDKAAVAHNCEDMASGRRPRNLNINRNYRKDGSIIHCEWYNSAIYDHQGRLTSVFSQVLDVTERKQAEQKILRQTAILEGINRIFHGAMTVQTNEQLGQVCLAVAEEITQSRFGFIGRIKDGVLDTVALSDPGWRACEMSGRASSHISPGKYQIRGIYGRVVTDGKSLFTNDPANHPDSIGLPEGHPPLTAFLGVPLIHEGATVGMVAVANRDGGYGQDEQDVLEALAPVVIEAFLRKRAEESLRASEQRLRMALDGGRMGLWEWDVESGRCIWNDRMHEIVGLDASEPVTHEKFLQHVHGRDIEVMKEHIQRSHADGSDDFQAEFRLVGDDGRIRWVAISGRVIRDASGRAIRRLGIMYDITERKRMERNLRTLNSRLEEQVHVRTAELREAIGCLEDEVARRTLAESQLREQGRMLDGFFRHTITPLAFMDRDFNFVQVNEAYAAADSKTPDYFVGKNHFDLYPHDRNKAIFERVVRTGQLYRAHAKAFSYPNDPLRVSYWDWQLTPLLDDRGQVQYLVLNLQDVTQRQTALRELEQRACQLQKLTLELSQAEDRERRRMAEVLHDGLQQQLAAAKFHVGLLNTRAKDDAPMREIAQQLNQVLRDAIEQSRNLSHELSPPVLHQSDLSDTFEWLAEQIRAKHGMAVETDIYGQVDSQSESIKTFLYRAAQEILFNTVKHAGVEEARLRLRRKGQQLWLAIADRGKGFDPTDLGKAAGFGLLSIRERVGLLGGRMKIRSVPGKGSVFAIAVPDVQIAREAERAGKTERPVAYVAPTSRVRRAVSGDRLRVLLVDDHKVVREGLAALIGEEEDMQVVGQAGDGSEAIERARELQPDVIIMDVSMPVMAGDEATRRIKAEMRHMRVIALSMFEEHSVGERMLDAGAELYLPKAGPSERLLAAIRGSNLTS